MQRVFPEIANSLPGPRVNQCEHLLTHMRVGTFRDREIRHTRVERRIDPAVIEVVAGAFHGRRSRATLVDERFERSYGIRRLFVLSPTLFESSLGAFVLRDR